MGRGARARTLQSGSSLSTRGAQVYRAAQAPKSMNPLDYKQAGVDYASIDPLKILAQRAAAATAGNLARHGLHEVAASRGESAYVVDCGEFYLASITECLGTKALVADAMRAITGRSYYDLIAQDTLAMALNDIITVGATPVSVHAYWASGGSEWFADAERARDLVEGWRAACDRSGVAWGGGETPALAGVVESGRIDLAASCVGLIRPKSRLTLGERLGDGDAIVLLASSGIHANGVSLARKLVERLPDGYRTTLADNSMYGEALLTPTVLYSPVTEALAAAGNRSALQRQHHRPWLAQAHAAPGQLQLPDPHAAARATGAGLHCRARRPAAARVLWQSEHGRRLRTLRGGERGRALRRHRTFVRGRGLERRCRAHR